MRKILVYAIVLAMVIVCGVASVNADNATKDKNDTSSWGWGFDLPGNGDSSFPSFSFEMPEMPEMPEFEGFGEFTMPEMPEGFGEFDISSFGTPKTGEWGNIGGDNSDWGSNFEDLRKQVQEGMSTPGSLGEDWPPQSFKDLQSAFDTQKSEEDSAADSPSSIQDLFASKFGDMNNTLPEMPSLDDKKADIDLKGFESKIVSNTQTAMNLETINGRMMEVSSKITGELNVKTIDGQNIDGGMDSLNNYLQEHSSIKPLEGGMFNAYSDLVSNLTPDKLGIDIKHKYNGNLFPNQIDGSAENKTGK